MRNMMIDRWLAAASACLIAFAGEAQLVLDNSQSPEYFVQNVLLGGGVVVSNVTFNGVPGTTPTVQMGSFNGTNSNVGMTQGIVLASGDINVAQGPNNSSGNTLPPSGLNLPGDPDLTIALGGNYTTNDAA